MKKALVAVAAAMILLFAQSCNKKEELQDLNRKPEVVQNNPKKELRDAVYENPQRTEAAKKAAELRGKTANTCTASGWYTRVILMKNGAHIEDPNWNSGVPFDVNPINENIFQSSLEVNREHFALFNVLITDDENIFLTYDVYHRTIQVVGITTVLGQVTGSSWKNSYLWGIDVPSFVLANYANPNDLIDDLGDLEAHESGHVFGLDHSYENGGSGFLTKANIMGQFNQGNFNPWTIADVAHLTPILGLKDDEYPDTPQTWTDKHVVGQLFSCVLTPNDGGDVCRIKGKSNSAITITVTSGGDWPVIMEVYNANYKFVKSVSTTTSLSASVQIAKGNKYWFIKFKKFTNAVFIPGEGHTTCILDYPQG